MEQEYLLLKALKSQSQSVIKRGRQVDGWPLHARLCAREISLESVSMQTQQKSFGWEYEIEVPCVYKHVKRSHIQVKDPVVCVRVRWITDAPK